MKRKVLIFLLCTMVFSLAGCGSKKNEEAVNQGETETAQKSEVGVPTLICKGHDEFEDSVVDSVITTTFDNENYINYQKIESTQTYEDPEIFNGYVRDITENDVSYGENIDYSYSIDEENKKISTTMVYKENIFNYSEVTAEEKEGYLASNYIKTAEDAGRDCEILGTTRSALGLQ